MRLTIGLLLFAAMPLSALAETAYVTDQLRLGLHRAEDTSDRSFRTLESGQELDILSQNRNYAQVRLPPVCRVRQGRLSRHRQTGGPDRRRNASRKRKAAAETQRNEVAVLGTRRDDRRAAATIGGATGRTR